MASTERKITVAHQRVSLSGLEVGSKGHSLSGLLRRRATKLEIQGQQGRLPLVKVRYGRLWFICGACCFILLAVSVATSGFRVLGTSETGHKPQKNPRLSTPLVVLSQSVKQESARPAVASAVRPPEVFSTETLPKPLRDAIQARQMHVTNNGEVQVYIELSSVAPRNLEELRSFGVTIQIVGRPEPDKSKSEVLTGIPTVQGLLPVTMIKQVSALPFVRYIRLPDYGFTNTGSVDSQGDQILRVAQARTQFGVDGTGIRVGVISGGIGGVFDTNCSACGPAPDLPSPILTGDLPNAAGVRNVFGILTSVSGGIVAQSFPASSPDLENQDAEGTAMLEIVHDLAPGAQLYFANAADGSSMAFEQAVDYITANTDVGVDDESFPNLPVIGSQLGQLVQYDGNDEVSVNTAADLNNDSNPVRGYFTSVGNKALHHYEEPWTDSGTSLTLSCPSGGIPTTGDVQLFKATSNTNDLRSLGPSLANIIDIPKGTTVFVFLSWNDPVAGSSNDYDLYLYSMQNGLPIVPLACSQNPQTGMQSPTEGLFFTNPTGGTLEVGVLIQNVNNAAAARTLDTFVENLGDFPQNLNFNTVAGSVAAESDAGGSPVSVVSVGATDAQMDANGNPPATIIEFFSSQGPTEATPNQQGAARMKPDITATDDVCVTGAGGFGSGPATNCPPSPPTSYTPQTFRGTSAAAPHAAAIAALVLQAISSSSAGQSPAAVRSNLRNFLTSTAVPLPGVSQPVPNNVEGFGLLDALAAVKAAGAALPSGTFSLSTNPATLSIAAPGQSGSSTITAAGTGGFAGSVSLTCSVSPVPANDPPTCFVNPSSIALSATTSSATASLRISTTKGLNSGLRPEKGPNKPDYFVASMGLALACMFLLRLFQRGRHRTLFGLAALVLLGVTLGSCAGGGGSNQINFGTPSGGYTVTVTATGGGTTQTTNVAVTLQ
jgi:hypothetical protein